MPVLRSWAAREAANAVSVGIVSSQKDNPTEKWMRHLRVSSP